MIAIMLTEATSAWLATAGAANGDGDASTAWLLILGPIAAVATYLGLWAYYRNTHRSHSYERETSVEAQPIGRHDMKRTSITGTKRARIERENRTNHRQRVQRFG